MRVKLRNARILLSRVAFNTFSVGCRVYVVGRLRSLCGGWEEKSTIMLNSAQFQVKFPTGAELGNIVIWAQENLGSGW